MNNLMNPSSFKNMIVNAKYECIAACGNVYDEVFPFGKVQTGRMVKYFVNTPQGVIVTEYVQNGTESPVLHQMYTISSTFTEVTNSVIRETLCGKYDNVQYFNNRD